jgi:hypothetical protein
VNVPLLRQACLNVGLVEPISIEMDGTVWTGTADDPQYPDPKPINKEYDRLLVEYEKSLSDARKRAAYERESDPIFFKWQRGEASEQDWRDAVAKVQASFPN